MNNAPLDHRSTLQFIARREMIQRGFLPEFSERIHAELAQMHTPARPSLDEARDLRRLPWCSIDNDDSLDLDQCTAAEKMRDGQSRILVAIADVEGLVERGMAIDAHALRNTTSIYTAAQTFPMLPEILSTNLTSLNPHEDRSAMVVDMVVNPDGSLLEGSVYPALVRNHAKLAYDSVAEWLDGRAPIPAAISEVAGLADALRLQDQVAQSMQALRHKHGALSLETLEARPVFEGNTIKSLATVKKNTARSIIEDFMIAANTVTADFLTRHGYPSITRVVRAPDRWERIVGLAHEHGSTLPDRPDALALQRFLSRQRDEQPATFTDISLAIIKLIGSGEYMAEEPGHEAPGHFGLAVSDYTHSTAPNRRYPDLIIQRQLKAALKSQPPPYSFGLLKDLAYHLTIKEDDAQKVERSVQKSAAALLLSERIGEIFEGIITGAAPKGTWVRLLSMPVEGKVVRGEQGLDIGQRVRVKLVSVDVDAGYIDFQRK